MEGKNLERFFSIQKKALLSFLTRKKRRICLFQLVKKGRYAKKYKKKRVRYPMDRALIAKLRQWKDHPRRKPLLLKGARQVGKTHLLRHFGSTDFANFHYFNFEEDSTLASFFEHSLSPKKIIESLEFHLGKPIHLKTDLVIFDEIQSCPKALTSLKYFQEERPELAICAAGSLLGVYLGEGSFPVGKVDMLDMFPLSFFEFLGALEEKLALEFFQSWDLNQDIPLSLHQRLWENLKIYFIVGGLPEVVQTFLDYRESKVLAFNEVRNKQNQLITAYLADIAKHTGKVNAMHVERVLRAIPSQLSGSEDSTAQKFRFKGVVPKVEKYSRLVSAFDWLESARISLKVEIINSGLVPFSAFAQENRFKLFMFDIGLLGAMSELQPESILSYDYGTYKGYFAENFVAQELCCSGISRLYSWQEGRSELEFLAQSQGNPVPIEVKSGWVTKAKSLMKFREKFHPKVSLILSAKELQSKGDLIYLPLYLSGMIPDLLSTQV